jgi:putative redox protein
MFNPYFRISLTLSYTYHMSKKITIKNIPFGYQSILSNGRNSILSDEPMASKGTDLGFSPDDLLLSSIAACKVATVRFFARKNGWEIGNVDAELDLTVHKTDNGQLKSHVAVKIRIEGDLTAAQRNELLSHADHCYVHRMITGEWDIAAATQL